MSQQLQNGKQQFFNGSGIPLAGGTVGLYTPGTLTPLNTWQDSGLTVLNSNPITLDGNGMAQIWGDDAQLYRQIVKDSVGNTIWDDVVGGNAAYASIQAGLKNYAIDTGVANAYVIALSPVITAYVNGLAVIVKFAHANTGASTLNAGAGAVPLARDDGAALVAGDILANEVKLFVYDLATNSFLSTGILQSQAVNLATVQSTVQSAATITALDTGAVNAYAMALTPAITAYHAGMMLNLEAILNTNTGASTINVNGLGALPIVRMGGGLLQGAELVTGYGAILRINAGLTAAELVYSAGNSVGVFKPGDVKEFAGFGVESGYLAVPSATTNLNIATYTALYNKITWQTTGTTNATTTISAVGSTAGLVIGFPICGPGIPANTTVAGFTSNSITLSQAATASAVGVALVIAPWGVGDGSTTFGIPFVPPGYTFAQAALALQSVGQMPAHIHTYNMGANTGQGATGSGGVIANETSYNTGSAGSGTANLAASVGINYIIKY